MTDQIFILTKPANHVLFLFCQNFAFLKHPEAETPENKPGVTNLRLLLKKMIFLFFLHVVDE